MEAVPADHDMSCGEPNTTHRDLPGGRVPAPGRTGPFVGPMTYSYWCAPSGNAAAAHLMTATNTGGYVILSFSPKQTFADVTKVCWSVNQTELGGGKWENMIAVPASTVKPKAAGWGPGVDLNFILDFSLDTSAMPMPANSLAVKDFGGTTAVQVDGNEVFYNGNQSTTQDKTVRFRHCVEQTGPNTLRITVARPGGGTQVMTSPGHFPTGPTRIVFQDDSYNPDKHIPTPDPRPTPAFTWHWDDLEITS